MLRSGLRTRYQLAAVLCLAGCSSTDQLGYNQYMQIVRESMKGAFGHRQISRTRHHDLSVHSVVGEIRLGSNA